MANASGVITSSSSPVVGTIIATSTATSTFASGVLVGAGSASLPSFSFIGDPDTGIYNSSGNTIGFAATGALRFQIAGGTFSGGNASGPALVNTGASASAPNILPSRAVTTTGFNSCTSGDICTIYGATEQSRWGRNGYGVSTTTPSSLLSVGMTTATSSFSAWMSGSTTPAFWIGSANQNGHVGVGTSTPYTRFAIDGNGSLLVTENTLATSTSMTIDWRGGNQQLIRKGSAGITLTFTGYIQGQKLLLTVCNPSSTGGSITWPAGVMWPAGTAPTQTTTANKCDLYSFAATNGTSTLSIFGASTLNF